MLSYVGVDNRNDFQLNVQLSQWVKLKLLDNKMYRMLCSFAVSCSLALAANSATQS